MNTLLRNAAATLVTVVPVIAQADNLAGTERFVCSSSQVTRCYALGNCETGPPWEWNMPSFVQIDLKKMTMSTPATSVEKRSSPIAKVERNDGQILLQGSENGRAFSMSITERTGLTSMALALDGMTISVFGACTPLE